MKASTWRIDPHHTSVEFAVKHMMIATVKGRFADVQGTFELDEEDPTRSRADIRIGTASIDTGVAARDQHLRSPDFFDVENHPLMTFHARRVEPGPAGALRIVGDLTIRGVTREVALEASEEGRGRGPQGFERIGFSARTVIDRRDFGLTWNAALETGGVVVSDQVRISLEVEAVRQSGEAREAA